MNNNDYKYRDIDTADGDDLGIALSYGVRDNEAMVSITYRDEWYDKKDKKNRHKHEHIISFDPQMAIEFSNILRDYAKEAFANNATVKQIKYEEELKNIKNSGCPF